MSEIDLSPEETATLIDYARQKYAEERYPRAAELREVGAVLMKLRPGPAPLPPAPHTSRAWPFSGGRSSDDP
jgi:hypothetical protein